MRHRASISTLVFLGAALGLFPPSALTQNSCPNVVEPKLAAEFQAALDARTEEQKAKEPKPIYGCDDRKNFYDPKLTEHHRKAAQATAVLVDRGLLTSSDEKIYEIKAPEFARKLCSPKQAVEFGSLTPERFWSEPSPGNCSAFKVGTRTMATAGHCIKNESDCGKFAFVFGFHMTAEDASPDKKIKSENVFRCKKIIAGEKSNDSDWRLIEVDRDIDAPQVDIRTEATTPPLAKGTRVTVVGYPMGLPVKVADGAVVTEVAPRYLKANLDTYGGNSGSVVFNSEKLDAGELIAEGILVSGEPDFKRESPCRLSKQCNALGCQKEQVTLASEFAKVLGK